MKKFTLSVFWVLSLSFILVAQTPQSFKYQAVVRDLSGNIIADQSVSFRVSILQSSETGIAVYSEIQSGATNTFGLITFNVGTGAVETGVFADINWSGNIYFLKIEIDVNGGTDYQFMGTSQLLSVPYSFHSVTNEKLISLTEAERDAMIGIAVGTCILNTTSDKLNYFNGSNWFEISGICIPQPTGSDAGPDQLNVAGATVTLAANTPITGTGSWTIIEGSGGYIQDPANPGSTFTGVAGTTYTLSWAISTDCSTSTDSVVIGFAPFTCGNTFKDARDNKIYGSVLIGTQCWMAKNINVGTRIEGVNNAGNNGIIEKYCTGNLESNCDVYGGLYQWNEMMQYVTTPGTQGICTPGWHLPTDNEIKLLEGTIDSQYGVGDPVWDLTGDRGLDAGGKMKETGNSHWAFPNTGATNTSGFTALPGGARNTDGSFPGVTVYGRFWTSSEGGTTAYRRVLSSSTATIARDTANKLFGLSVRCVKD